ncbi:ISKra4 family transposase [Paraburkholderia sp. CNPSo 3274]|uniref:ISKra4 family transposase n=1 Tax=Paraburkholderia sp. CNPSo 3274 TaxID=2940932 RepID=UPI0020B6F963|nr:ISKra4 family transposase [Paraburkholderia sp. CNPSo 3274]MCP3711800.1 ISKra4 family transposase [Paraburkholderia sp. CNPSo 3274]
MQISVQIVVQTDVDEQPSVTEIAHFEREGFDAGSLGLHLDEAKALLGQLQRSMIDAQAAESIARMSVCPECGLPLTVKGHHRLVYRSVFGRLSIDSPRYYQCRCSGAGPRSLSPLASCLRERTSPELQYLQAKFAALMSYGLTVRVLEDVLPLEHVLAATTIRRRVAGLGRRLESSKATIAVEQPLRVDPPAGRRAIPQYSSVRAVGIDGGYIRLAGHSSRQDGWFEVIVGKSLHDDGGGHSFAYVHTLEHAPAERMLAFLAQEGVGADQPVTFLSDGGDTVRRAQLDFGDCGEKVLDWFHVAMRVQNLEQVIKGLPDRDERPSVGAMIDRLHSAKWHLWHGCPYPALQRLESLGWELAAVGSPEEARLLARLDEFIGYIENNQSFIVNYGDRYRHGEPITSSFVESAVNQVVSKRFVKRQQMAWRPALAHALLQVRTAVLNEQLRSRFERWYPTLALNNHAHNIAA